MTPPLDPSAFITANTQLLYPPHVPEVCLHLAAEAFALWQKTEDELGAMGLPPPFWAFAWAGGQAVARYVLDHPETVRHRVVLDLASGSGISAIAAAKAGAARVIANDVDVFSTAAIALNAQANDVHTRVETRLGDVLNEEPGDVQVVMAGDVFYQQHMADRVLAFLDKARAKGAQVLVGDPGRSFLPRQRLTQLAEFEVAVTRALEDTEVRKTVVWGLR